MKNILTEAGLPTCSFYMADTHGNVSYCSLYKILSLQVKTFDEYYHLAIPHHQYSLIIIHGVGEGVLRDEIHDILRLRKEVKSFVNQYHPNFGYGATEIFFQY